MHLLGVIRTAVERSAAEILEKEITLGPELLEIESSENAGDRFHVALAELVAAIRVRRFAHLQRGRDKATGGRVETEPRLIEASDRRVLRVQDRRVLAEGGSRRGLWLRRGTGLGGGAQAHAENQERQPDCLRFCHAFHRQILYWTAYSLRDDNCIPRLQQIVLFDLLPFDQLAIVHRQLLLFAVFVAQDVNALRVGKLA